jgi:hypothetical protein
VKEGDPQLWRVRKHIRLIEAKLDLLELLIDAIIEDNLKAVTYQKLTSVKFTPNA